MLYFNFTDFYIITMVLFFYKVKTKNIRLFVETNLTFAVKQKLYKHNHFNFK